LEDWESLPELTFLNLFQTMIDRGLHVNSFLDSDKEEEILSRVLSLGVEQRRTVPTEEHRRHVNLISRLLELGASVTKVNALGLTAMHFAAKYCPSLLPILKANIDREPVGITETLLFLGPEQCLSLLEKSLDIDESDIELAILYAAILRHREVVSHFGFA
jgi:hypothetical protein